MNSPNWRAAAEIVAVISIVVSLIFVALELRQSTAQARLEAFQSFSLSLSEFAREISHDPEFASLLIRVETSEELSEDVSPAERVQLFTHFVGLLHLYNGLYQSAAEGLILEEYREAIQYDPAFSYVYFQDLWPRIESMFEPGFREFVERTLIE